MRKIDRTSNAMHHISDLFAVYQARLRPPQKTVERIAASVITDVTGIVVTDTEVIFTPTSRVLALRTSSVVKVEILVHHVAIINRLNLELGVDRAPLTIL